MSEIPEELDEFLDDPASYSDESEEDFGDIPLLDGLMGAIDEDLEGVEFEEGFEDYRDPDADLGQDPAGNPSEPIPGPLEPVSAWSEVDEDGQYEELLPVDEEPVDEPEEDLSEPPEIDEEDENEPQQLGPEWAKYELWGRDRDEPVEWQLLSIQDYGQDAEAEIEGLRTGARMEFRVRLVSTDNVTSEWSDLFYYSLPSDLTPPPAPTPPTAEDNAGFITHYHDGSLTEEVPDDMSHRVLYAQQMHPAGDPEGPAGDPMRIAEWRGTGASSITVGRYVDRTEHRAWLVAVDTTGNESARSEYVYFTASKPFDVADFEERLMEFSNGELEDAAYDNLMARLGEFLTVRTDQLVANDINGNTATVPLLQSHADEKGWKHRPDGTSAWRDVATGELNTEVRGNGTLYTRGAEIEGVLNAKGSSTSGVRLSSGPVTYREGYNVGESWELNYRSKTVDGPYLKWLRDDVPENESPTLVWDEDGNLVAAPYQSSTGTGAFMVQGPMVAERIIAEGNARVSGNLQVFGTIGTYQSINFPNSYTANRPCFYRRLGQLIFLSGSVNSNVNNNFGGSICQVPPPPSTAQLISHRTNSAGALSPMPITIGTDGWLSVPGGSDISSGTPMSLDGLVYIAG